MDPCQVLAVYELGLVHPRLAPVPLVPVLELVQQVLVPVPVPMLLGVWHHLLPHSQLPKVCVCVTIRGPTQGTTR